MNKVLQNPIVRYIIILIAGIAIGAIFYPSKTITTEETSKFEQKIERLETEKKNISTFFEKQLSMEKHQSRKYQEQTTKKIDSYKEENYKLKQKVSEKRFKIVRPDGTIEEKWYRESETEVVASVVTEIKEEFTRKVKSIENKWKVTHEKRIKKIKENYERKLAENITTKQSTHKKTKTEINKRNFGISLGLTSEKDYFSSITYDIAGPLFLDIHVGASQSLNDQEIGIGIGIRF